MDQPTAPARWRLGCDRSMSLDRSRIIAILNITPDSFSDGGVNMTVEAALRSARAALDAGADMLDIGGESTRPGAAPVTEDEQCDRVIPVIRAIRAAGVEAPISVDTTRSVVAEAALDAGADVVNDVSGGEDDEEMLRLIARRGCAVILMHRRIASRDDRYSHEHRTEPDYGPDGVVAFVRRYLADRAEAATRAGVRPDCIALDPGLGFGKSVRQNFALIRESARLVELGHPVLGAASRKSFLGAVSGVDSPADRVAPSVAASVMLHHGGVRLFRVHDVPAHRQALSVADAALEADI